MSKSEQGEGQVVSRWAKAFEGFFYGDQGVIGGLKLRTIEGCLASGKEKDDHVFGGGSISRERYRESIEGFGDIVSFRADLVGTDFIGVVVLITPDSVEVERRAKVKGPNTTDVISGDRVKEIDDLIGVRFRQVATDCGISLEKNDNFKEETGSVICLSYRVSSLNLG